MAASIESIKHEVETNSGSSLKDAVSKNQLLSNELLDLSKTHADDLQVLKQKFENDKKFSKDLQFTITPTGVSKSNHTAKAFFGYPVAEDG